MISDFNDARLKFAFCFEGYPCNLMQFKMKRGSFELVKHGWMIVEDRVKKEFYETYF